MTNWYNYFLSNKNSRLTQGHIKSSELYHKILNHDGSEAYCCYFDLEYESLKNEYWTGEYDEDFDYDTGETIKTKKYAYLPQNETPKADYYKPEITFTQYEGIARPALNMVSFDFDGENLDDVLNDVRDFVEWLGIDDIAIFFSGSKGFHVMMPFNYFPNEISPSLPLELKDMAKELEKKFPSLDTSIYNYNRKFRVPFTKHDKTGLFKNLVSVEDTIEEILERNKVRLDVDFVKSIMPSVPREPLEVLIELFESCKRKSYEIEKDKGGTKNLPTKFEAWNDKKCIERMLNSRCDDIGRNNAALRIVNDFFRTGRFEDECRESMEKWASRVKLPWQEVNTIIKNVYRGNANYNFGCQDECKSQYCSAKCHIWGKLDHDKRPEAPDAPKGEASKIKSDFEGVDFLMNNVFNAYYDDEKEAFSFGSIVKQTKDDLFLYKDNYWQHLEQHHIDFLKQKLNAKFNNKLNGRRLNAIIDLLAVYAPQVPDGVDLFSPNGRTANFKDGTLHLVNKDGKFKLEFKEHNRLDFCTSRIEASYLAYIDDKEHINERFEKWIMHYCGNNEDNYKLIQEMFASTLLAFFPQVFFILGKSGTGKSTTMKILKRMHDGAKYISGVSPDKFNGFHMASMIGKLINIVMDIKVNCKIDDDVIKQIDDKEPVRYERKRLDDVYAPLPPTHIFGANAMPMTMEGYSGAMFRRVSIINFDVKFKGEKNLNIANDLFDYDPQGVLNFALRGLERLVMENNGEFTRTSQSIDNVREWTKSADVIEQFFDDVSNDGVIFSGQLIRIVKHDNIKLRKIDLWKYFRKWQLDAIEKNYHLGKIKFYQKLRKNGYEFKHYDDGDYLEGIGLESDIEGDNEI